MRILTTANGAFNTPYPNKCPEWCKEGALVRRTVKDKSLLLGEYEDMTVYEIVSIHWLNTNEGKGIWGMAYLRPRGTEGRWTKADYICDLKEYNNN